MWVLPFEYIMLTRLHSLQQRLFVPQDIDLLVYFRIAFGALMLWEVWRYFSLNRIARYYIDPTFHFSYYGFDWVQPLTGVGMYVVFATLGVLAISIMLGFCYRLSMLLFFILFTYIFLLDQALYLNHFYLIALLSFLLIFVPAHRALSLDAWRNRSIASQTAPTWALWLLRAQLGIVYFFGGIAKLNGDWLQGEPMRMWLAERTAFPLIGSWFTQEWVVTFFSYGGLLFDLLVFPLLLWRRTRMIALLIALCFHLMNSQLFSIGVFPWFMIAANMLFLPVGSLRRVLRLPISTNKPVTSRQSQRLVVTALVAYFALQICLPLRHFLYPGDVNWTEEGHRFSWHMKLRDKSGAVRFYLTDPVQQITWEANPLDYLTTWQQEEMVGRPDMILQFAHYLAALQPTPVEVRVLAQASLNGRRRQVLIDPEVDLAAQPRTLLYAAWIIPLDVPLNEN